MLFLLWSISTAYSPANLLPRQNALIRPCGAGHSRVCRVRARACVSTTQKSRSARRTTRPCLSSYASKLGEWTPGAHPARTCTCNTAVRSSTRTGDRPDRKDDRNTDAACRVGGTSGGPRQKVNGNPMLNRAFALVLSDSFVPSSRNETFVLAISFCFNSNEDASKNM
jgi:hypothetical protein